MELKMTECNGICGASDFFNDILRFGNVIDYTRAIVNTYEEHDGDFCDKQSCVGEPLFAPRYFSVSFNGKTYTVVEDGELILSSNDNLIYDLIDAMFEYASDSHTFDFIQDNIKITLDIFEHELVIEL